MRYITMTPGGVYGKAYEVEAATWYDGADEAERLAEADGYEVYEVMDARDEILIVVADGA